MKISTFVLAFCIVLAFSSSRMPSSDSNLAEVKQYQKVYVFVDSKPVFEYEKLGTVKAGFGSYEDIRERLIEKAKKNHPTVEGIILKTNGSGSFSSADAIKFK